MTNTSEVGEREGKQWLCPHPLSTVGSTLPELPKNHGQLNAILANK